MKPIRVALATGSIHLPQKHFVLDHALQLRGETETDLFTYSATGMSEVPSIPLHELVPRMRLPHDLRRRLYPVGSKSLSRKVVEWQPDVVHLHFLALGAFAARASRIARVPLVTTVHALEPHLLESPRNSRQRHLRDQCLRVLEETALFLAVSGYIEQWLLDLGVPQDSIAVNYLGIDTDFWTPSPSGRAKRAVPRLLFVGNLTELKGIRDLVRASAEILKDLPHVLDVIGDGPLREEIEGFAELHPHIEVHGRRSRAEVRQAMDAARCLVLPTQTHDGISDAAPFVLMEAQSMGLPAICYRVGGTAELMSSPHLLIPEGDTSALRDRMTELLSMNEAEYEVLSEHSRAWIVANRSRGAGAKSTLGHYQRLLLGIS